MTTPTATLETQRGRPFIVLNHLRLKVIEESGGERFLDDAAIVMKDAAEARAVFANIVGTLETLPAFDDETAEKARRGNDMSIVWPGVRAVVKMKVWEAEKFRDDLAKVLEAAKQKGMVG